MPPRISNHNITQSQVDQEIQVYCESRDGRPPAQLQWFLNDGQLSEGVSRPRYIDTITNQNTTLKTVIVQLQRHLRASDDGKVLICRATHPADQDQEDRVYLHVRC